MKKYEYGFTKSKSAPLKHNARKLVLIPLAVIASFSALCSCSTTNNTATNNDELIQICPLPDKQTVVERLDKIFSDSKESFVFGYGDFVNYSKIEFFRKPIQKGTPIKVNICSELSDPVRAGIELGVEVINHAFDLINPNYEAVVEYSPTKADIDNPFNVDLYIVNEDEMLKSTDSEEKVLGEVHYISFRDTYEQIEGNELYNPIVKLNKDKLTTTSSVMNVFLHEFGGHCFGIGDAYKNEDATKETFMQSGSVTWLESGGTHLGARYGLTNIDFAILSALYYDKNVSPLTPTELAEYSVNYQDSTINFEQKANDYEHNFRRDAFLKNFGDDTFDLILNKDNLIKQVEQLGRTGMYDGKEIEKMLNAIKSDERNSSFGNDPFRLGQFIYKGYLNKDNMDDDRERTVSYLKYTGTENVGDFGNSIYQYTGSVSRKYDDPSFYYSVEGNVQSQILYDGILIQPYSKTNAIVFIKFGDYVVRASLDLDKNNQKTFEVQNLYKTTNLSGEEWFEQYDLDAPDGMTELMDGDYVKPTSNFKNIAKEKDV